VWAEECVDFVEVLYLSQFPVILFLRVPLGHRLGVS
jgi:hypothetical protein